MIWFITQMKRICLGRDNPFMYHFLVLLQYFGIFALIVEIFYVSRQQSSKLQMALVLLLYSSLINIVGYTMEIQAGKQQVAIQATKFSYMVSRLLYFLCICLLWSTAIWLCRSFAGTSSLESVF